MIGLRQGCVLSVQRNDQILGPHHGPPNHSVAIKWPNQSQYNELFQYTISTLSLEIRRSTEKMVSPGGIAMDQSTWLTKTGLAQMLKGGVIMDVVTPEHARIAEEAGACAVMALERVPADIRAAGGVARMRDPELSLHIMEAVTIPVMAKCRIGHFVEAQILQSLGGDYIDES